MQIIKSLSGLPAFYCILLLVLSACDLGNVNDLQAYVAGVKSRQYAGIEPLPHILGGVPYSFNVNGQRDPFNPIEHKTISVAQCTRATRRRDALEGFPLQTLTMVGSLERDKERWALIQTQDGGIHRRKVNDYVGEDNGQIKKITENSIELLELISQGGGCVNKTTILTLNE
jgi:type IV pilus assembly protein PilP